MSADGEPSSPPWRDAAAYRRLLSIDRAGLMWEWLRRDAGYVAWHARASSVTRGASPPIDRNPEQWGFYFRRTAGHRRAASAPHLASGL
jgi:hypothetical protein